MGGACVVQVQSVLKSARASPIRHESVIHVPDFFMAPLPQREMLEAAWLHEVVGKRNDLLG